MKRSWGLYGNEANLKGGHRPEYHLAREIPTRLDWSGCADGLFVT